MLDVKKILENPDKFKKFLDLRNTDNQIIDTVTNLEKKRVSTTTVVDNLRAEKKQLSKQFGMAKAKSQDTSILQKEIEIIKTKQESIELELIEIKEELRNSILTIPNVLAESVPPGKNEEDNIEIRKWSSGKSWDFNVLDHVAIGEKLNIIDLERASKVTGARFVFMIGAGAKLERALINFMLDTHTNENGYKEILSPFIANEQALTGTGQLPKFAEDLFKIEGKPYYMISTAEIPVTNYYANEIIDFDKLPVKFAGYTACFRSEAGSHGRDTRGIIRQHQFNKVELVKIVKPENSEQEHEDLTKDAEKILQLLELDYRVVELSSGDIGFGAAKCYDIEVWLPSEAKYREISSCSNYLDFQSRRANIRYRNPETKKPSFVHTINGSGLAIGRTVVAILEQYQNKDGSINVPKVLQHYLGYNLIK